MDKESPEEKLNKAKIEPVERECLDRVFDHLSKCAFMLYMHQYREDDIR